MKYLRCTLRFADEVVHPVHRRLGDDPALVADHLLTWNVEGAGHDAFLYYVEGDHAAYGDVLGDVDRIVDHAVAPVGDDDAYAYVRQDSSRFERDLLAAFSRGGLVVVPPVTFAGDHTARVGVLGDPGDLRAALDDVPAVVEVTVDRVGEYAGRRPAFDPGLTPRQVEAVAAAVEVGYYDVPREGSTDDVAERLGCSGSTAAEHLRKAEAAAMRALVAHRDP